MTPSNVWYVTLTWTTTDGYTVGIGVATTVASAPLIRRHAISESWYEIPNTAWT